MPEPEPLSRLPFLPLVAVVDSCVFLRWTQLRRLIDSARAGYVVLVWSPLIIAEVNRLLTWWWIEHKGGGRFDAAARRRCSADLKKWFSIMTGVFHVVEDHPPPEPLWTDRPRDPWDEPVWTAAVRARRTFRAGGTFVVTANLKDGPPTDEHGIRHHGGIVYMHPERFNDFLDHYASLVTSGQHSTANIDLSALTSVEDEATELHERLAQELRELLRSLPEEAP